MEEKFISSEIMSTYLVFGVRNDVDGTVRRFLLSLRTDDVSLQEVQDTLSQTFN